MTLAYRIARNHALLLELALHDGDLWEVTDRRARMVAFVDEWYRLQITPLTGVWS